MRNSVNPKMILLARESRGLTQQALAEMAGTNKVNLSRLENGDSVVSDETLAGIATATGYPVSFFFQTGEVLPLSLAYRKREKVPASIISPIEAQINIMRLQLEKLITLVKLAAPVIPVFEVTDELRPSAIALRLRQVWKIKTAEIPDMAELLEEKGILIQSFDFGTERVDSKNVLVREKYPVIFLNASLLGDRQRFSLAYQLGHFIMHTFCKVPHDRDISHEANEFAASFLMPERYIRKELENGISIPLLGELKQKWKVSMISLLYRADDLGLLTPNQKRYQEQQFNQLNIRRREPAELDIAIEEPKRIRQLMDKCQHQLQQHISGISALFCMLESEFLELYGEPTHLKSI
ncbi:MAG: XRE family transcriptional regulator [Bacteroidetes bacterium]|nr:XRE family transcriptional regulator [Bacteroidota bacterium]